MSPAELTAWATVAIAIVTAGVGATTCFLVWYGIREMRRSSDERARDRRADRQRYEAAEEAGRRRYEAAEEADRRRYEAATEAERLRHEEVMEELRAQNRRIDAQIAGFDAQNRRLDAQSGILEAQSRALLALVERTAPAAPAE